MPGASRLGDKAQIQQDAHGCPGCPHPGVGPAIAGSTNVMINGRPAVRLDDVGIHAVCCGPNMWSAAQGSTTVFINGKPAVRNNDQTRHCGGSGKMIEGSPDVIIGGAAGTGSSSGGGGGGSGDSSGGTAGGGSGGGSTASTGNSGGSGGAAAGSSSSTSSAATANQAAAGQSASTSAVQSQNQTQMADQFVMAVTLQSPGGQLLANEQVSVIDPDTYEVVVGPVDTNEKGELRVVVPQNKKYHLQVAEDDLALVQPDDNEFSAHLHAQFVTKSGELIRAEPVRVSGNGISSDVETGDFGQIDLLVPLGAYELEISDQKFKVHAMQTTHVTRAEGEHHVFVVDSDPEWDDFHEARLHREHSDDEDSNGS